MLNNSISDLSLGLKKKEFSSVEIAKFYLDRIRLLNNKFNCFITISEEHALAQARIADQKIQQGKATILTGVPIVHKDIFCTKGIKSSAGSKMLDPFIAPYDATVVEKLNNAGTIMLGKTNMDEFAMGASNEHSYYGPVKNPWDIERVPGGSSGGSAAVVAARLVPGSTGSDTGGSIRQPASFCGVTGLKPTYGRVSRHGMIAFASSLDQAGPFGQTAKDCALLLQYMSGFDEKDSTCSTEPVPDYVASLNNKIDNLTIGLPKEFFNSKLNPDISALLEEAIKQLEKLGVKFKQISLPNIDTSIAAYYIIAPAECSSNLARYDGVRFGYRAERPKDLEDLYKRSRSIGFGNEVKRRILIGTYVLSAGYYDDYYLKAQKIRQVLSNDFKKAFTEVDVILSPTSPNTAFKLGEKLGKPTSLYLEDIYTVAVNLAGLPGISIPAGFKNNLPIGLHLIGNHFKETTILNIAHQYQQVTDWHKRLPTSLD